MHGRKVILPSPVSYAEFDNDPDIKRETIFS